MVVADSRNMIQCRFSIFVPLTAVLWTCLLVRYRYVGMGLGGFSCTGVSVKCRDAAVESNTASIALVSTTLYALHFFSSGFNIRW